MPTHYETLQINKDADAAEIKRAYRALSLQWHPDRNSAPEAQAKFQEINEAYETLSDPAKKEIYDAEQNGTIPGMFFRTTSMDSPGPDDMADINHILNMMFSGGFGHPMGQGPGGPGPNIHIFHGQGFPGQGFPGQGFPGQGFPGQGFVPPGFGSAFGPGFGQGGGPTFSQNLQKPPPIIKSVNITFQQAYSGCTVPVEIEKWSIIENLKISENATVELVVNPGVDDKEMIVLRDCGNTSSNGVKGDIKFIVSIEHSPMFERHGMDLLYKKQLSLKESLCGFSFEVIHPNGKQLILNNMTNRTIIKPGFKKVISNMGMVRDGNSGNLVIEFSVVYPDNLNSEQMTALESIL